MTNLWAAVIAFLGVIVANFVAEDFRRFRDGQALAAALAGEIRAHGESFKIMSEALRKLSRVASEGKKAVDLSGWPKAASPVFDANAQKLGLLAPILVLEVAHFYGQVHAVPIAYGLVSKSRKLGPPTHDSGTVKICTAILDRAREESLALIDGLIVHAKTRYATYLWAPTWQRVQTLG